MIGEFLLDAIFNNVTWLFDSFNSFGIFDIAWDVGSAKWSTFFDIVRSICYFLPVDTISTIVGLIVSFAIFRVVIRLIITIWDLLPIV